MVSKAKQDSNCDFIKPVSALQCYSQVLKRQNSDNTSGFMVGKVFIYSPLYTANVLSAESTDESLRTKSKDN